MAAPAPNQRLSNTPGPTATSWARSGEPGSASSNSSRGGKARGSFRSHRGHSSRGGPREIKTLGAEYSSDKPNLASTSNPDPILSAKPGALAAEKLPVALNSSPSARIRRNPRPVSRSIPAIVPTPAGTDIPSKSSFKSSRSRRSQTGKSAPTLTKVDNVPSHDGNLRPSPPPVGSVPHTTMIKDVPPHLTNNSTDEQPDALHERVGAVNLDDRSHSPGSHIDWAGDDDDSLPDLDDWGITSVKAPTNENGLISPLGVSDLKPLPEMVTDAETCSPRQKSTNGVIFDQNKYTRHRVESTHSGITAPITTTQEPLVSAPGSAKVSLCPSLPPHAANVTGQDEVVLEDIQITATVAEVGQALAASIHSPNASPDKEDPFPDLLPRNGLAASIHAPHPAEITESKSVPNNLSSYSRASPEHGTHNRSRTNWRPPYPRADINSRPSRSGYNTPRGGLSAGGSHHTRTHSTPPTGGHTRRSPAHRPVITGDALSLLAKTIGGKTSSATRISAISAANK